jgi:signal peptidase II
MNRRFTCAALLGLTGGLAGCDLATKHLASRELAGSAPVEIVPGIFDLRYAENRDTAFSLTRMWGDDMKPVVLAVLASLVLVALVAWWYRSRGGPLVEQIGYAVALGGALGNVLDRIFRGYVIDFLHIRHWPIFNVADIAVVVGLGLLLVAARGRARGGGQDTAPA